MIVLKLPSEPPITYLLRYAKKNLIIKKVIFGLWAAYSMNYVLFGTHLKLITKPRSFLKSSEESIDFVTLLRYSPIPEFYSKDLKDIIDLCLERDYKRRPTTSNILSRPSTFNAIQKSRIKLRNSVLID